jgi:hypothetical protein
MVDPQPAGYCHVSAAAYNKVSPHQASGNARRLQPVALGRASDEQLMRRCRGPASRSFTSGTSRVLYLYRMLGNVEDVEATGVFLRATASPPAIGFRKFSTWLFTITRNLAINTARAKNAALCNVTDYTWKAWR